MNAARNAYHSCAFVLALAAICGCSDPEVLTLDVTPGQETDAFSRDPTVTRVDVTAYDADGTAVTAVTSAPGGSFSLGEVSVDALLRFEVHGYDGAGTLQMRGRSLALLLGAFRGDVVPVFAQRLDGWARPPGGLPHSHVGGVGAVLGERYLMLTGGEGRGADSAAVAFYDLLALGGTVGGTLSLLPRSLVMSADGTAALFIDDSRAVWIDFDSGDALEVPAPTGLGGYEHVAGGRTVVGPSASYVVGATRAEGPSDRVLVITAERGVTSALLTAERSGAAAAWVDDVGLVVAGGSETAAGAEVLGEEASVAVALPFEADPTVGAGATASGDAGELLLACGSDAAGPAAVRTLALGCGSDCAAVELAIDLGMTLNRCDAYHAGARLLLVGNQPDGEQRAFSLDILGQTAAELSLREPRRGAVTVAAPNGTLALMGGEHLDGSAALSVEVLFPE